ncbi:MAG: PhzF family phenazine biosynthesis protein [Myxococcota bacterium]
MTSTRERRFSIVNVFTTEPFGGNPLCVFEDAEDLDASTMQAVARQLNLSETTFVLPSSHPECDVRVRIFTPHAEMPMAGHPTIGTAFVLGRDRLVFEEGVGPVEVERVADDVWQMTQPPLRVERSVDVSAALPILGLAREDLLPDLPIQIASTGNPFMMMPLRDVSILSRISLSTEAWARFEDLAHGVYPFAPTETGVQARLLGVPGISEDPATGSAAGPLAAYLRHHRWTTDGPLEVRQGVEMGRPSTITVDCVQREGAWVPKVRGPSVRIGTGVLFL